MAAAHTHLLFGKHFIHRTVFSLPTRVLALHEAVSKWLLIPLSLSLNPLSVFQFAPYFCLLVLGSLLSLSVHLSPRHKAAFEALCLMMDVVTRLDPGHLGGRGRGITQRMLTPEADCAVLFCLVFVRFLLYV